MKGVQINQYRKNGSLILVFELIATKVAQDEFLAIEAARQNRDIADMPKSDNGNPLYHVNETMRNRSGNFTPSNITLAKRFDGKGYFIDTAIQEQKERQVLAERTLDKMADYAAQLRLGIIRPAANVSTTPATVTVTVPTDNTPAAITTPVDETLRAIEASELVAAEAGAQGLEQ